MIDKNIKPVYVAFTTEMHTKLKEVASKKGLRPSQDVRSSIINILNKIK